jgi:hypothetical protein
VSLLPPGSCLTFFLRDDRPEESVGKLHASLRRGEPLEHDPHTGEVRVPLALYSYDDYQADTELVLSRREVEALFGRLMTAGFEVPLQRRPETVR